jgi:hypothetical protein
MDTVTLTGTTIRGSVKGRTINCSVRSAPAGLRLPPGQYVLKALTDNPVHGPTVSIEGGGSSPASQQFKGMRVEGAPGSTSPAAIATLVPPGVAGAAHNLTAPGGAPGIMKWTPPGAPQSSYSKVAPTGLKDVAAGKVDAPAGKYAPAAAKFLTRRVCLPSAS